MNKRVLLSFIVCLVSLSYASGQNADELRRQFEDFKNKNRKEYSDFRNKVNQEYAQFMRETWEKYGSKPPVEKPAEEKPVVPVQFDESIPRDRSKINVIEHEHSAVVPAVVLTPQPKPAFPIVERVPLTTVEEERPSLDLPKFDNNSKLKQKIKDGIHGKILDTVTKLTPVDTFPVVVDESQYFNFSFLGTKAKVRLTAEQKIVLTKCKENNIADAWEKYSQGEYDNLIYDCLQLREKHQLCDWAYLQMLQSLAQEFYGSDKNSATLMLAYIYCQSGYQIRMGMTAQSELVLLYSSHHMIYSKPYYTIEGVNYYPLNFTGNELNICKAKFPKEQPLSLQIAKSPVLDVQKGTQRDLQSKKYNSANAHVTINKNLIDFYQDYPSSIINDNTMTRWAIFANTPLNLDIIDELYPSLRKSLEGKTEDQALNILLNFVQTAFVYEYDDKVWGTDRIFFAEETLYYPYCDCEDRSILFSRLVRDLLGLDVLLVYYPGHLATAVKVNNRVNGDYLILNNDYYIVCDPTYINAPIGETMPNMDNSKAKLILLN